MRESWIDGAISVGIELAFLGTGFEQSDEEFISREQFAFDSFDEWTFIGRIGYWWPALAAAATAAATAACIKGGLRGCDWFSDVFDSFNPLF